LEKANHGGKNFASAWSVNHGLTELLTSGLPIIRAILVNPTMFRRSSKIDRSAGEIISARILSSRTL
jgi:hypothetical protein